MAVRRISSNLPSFGQNAAYLTRLHASNGGAMVAIHRSAQPVDNGAKAPLKEPQNVRSKDDVSTQRPWLRSSQPQPCDS
jgi:hypothetical protein